MPCPVIIATIMRPIGDTGVQTHFQAYSQWLVSKDKACALVTPLSSPKWMVYPIFAIRRILELTSATISVWWYRRWHMVFLRRALYAVLRHQGSCVIYTQCPLSAAAAIMARASGVQRVVMTVHFNVSQADEWAGKGCIAVDGWLFREIRRFEEEVLPRVDGLVFVSEFARKVVSSRIPGISKVPYRVIPNFLPDPGYPEIATDPVGDLLCVGTLEPRKNQRYALEIVAAARRLGKSLRLTLVGDGPDRNALLSAAQELGVTEDVTFLGYVKHASMLMRSHLACLHVARLENLPITLIEALSAGVPVFAPAVGGNPEVFDDGVQGLHIPLDQPEAAAKLIISWLEDPEILASAGKKARDRFISKFESEIVASELTNFLHGTGISHDVA